MSVVDSSQSDRRKVQASICVGKRNLEAFPKKDRCAVQIGGEKTRLPLGWVDREQVGLLKAE